ncbi:MAG: glycosyltransferase family 39 protein [Anaerolineae bacterium]|nr:glycosyltransferase family 39 protein [Anaerolineae bacterium]
MPEKPPLERYTRLDYVLLAGLALAALIGAVLMAWFVTERLPHLEDEIAYIFQARIFARGALWAPPEPEYGAFFTPFVVDDFPGKRIGKYPIGWPLVLAAGEAVDAGWLVNPLIASATAVLAYALGRDLYDRRMGILSAILLISSPFFLLQSATFMSHPAAMLWLMLFMWAFLHTDLAVEAGREGRGWSALAGLALGLMILTRQMTALAAVTPFVIYGLVRFIRGQMSLREAWRRYWPLAAIAIAVTLLQPLYLTVVTGSPTTNLYRLIWDYDRIGFGLHGYGVEGDHTLPEAWRNARRDLRLLWSDLFGWNGVSWLFILPGAIAGTVWAKPGRRVWPWLLLSSFVSIVVVYMAYWIGAEVYGPRYYYEGIAGLAILSSLGLAGAGSVMVWLLQLLPGGKRAGRTEATLIAAGVLTVLIGWNVIGYLPKRLGDWHALYTISRDSLDELDRLRQTDHVLLLVRDQRWRDYAEFFALNSPWYDGPIVAAHDLNPRTTRAVLALYPDREVWYFNTGEFTPEPAPYTR